ncbi:MAG: hypothetical protein Q9220_003126 [cf. Caloplaca sp. 1 TL-2023]
MSSVVNETRHLWQEERYQNTPEAAESSLTGNRMSSRSSRANASSSSLASGPNVDQQSLSSLKQSQPLYEDQHQESPVLDGNNFIKVPFHGSCSRKDGFSVAVKCDPLDLQRYMKEGFNGSERPGDSSSGVTSRIGSTEAPSMTAASTIDDGSIEGSRNPGQDTDQVKLVNPSSRSESDSVLNSMDQTVSGGEMTSNRDEWDWKVLHWMQKWGDIHEKEKKAVSWPQLIPPRQSPEHSLKAEISATQSWDNKASSMEDPDAFATASVEALQETVPNEARGDAKPTRSSLEEEMSDVRQSKEEYEIHPSEKTESPTEEETPLSLTATHGCLWETLRGLYTWYQSLFEYLLPAESPISTGKTRIRWRCLRPGAAQEFETMLRDYNNQRPNDEQSSSSQSPDSAGLSSPNLSGASTSSVAPVSQVGVTAPTQSYNPRPMSGQHTSATVACDPESKWLLVCARALNRPTTLLHMNVCAMSSDRQLFSELRQSYLQLKRAWYHRFSLKVVSSIRFVQFELHPKDLVDVRKAPDMPPQARQDEYQYQPYDLLPPVGESLMTHLFHHPHDANEKAITFLRSPKKRKQRLAICPQKGTNVGWGIHLVEGWAMTKIWLLALTMYLSSSLIFAVSWSILEHDVQGAFGVASYFIALSGLGLGTIQAHIT